MNTLEHYQLLALMDGLRSKGILNTEEIEGILEAGEQNFVDYKESVEEKIRKGGATIKWD